MPDNQQRKRAAGEPRPPESPSTGRRGSHPAAEPRRDDGDRAERKQKSLYERPRPIEQGGD